MSSSDPHNQRLALRRTPDDAGLSRPGAFGSDAEDLLSDARGRVRLMEEAERLEGERVARRLIGSFALVVLVGLLGFVVLPMFGMRLPPYVWVLIFATIVLGTLLSMHGERSVAQESEDEFLRTDARSRTGPADGRTLGPASSPGKDR